MELDGPSSSSSKTKSPSECVGGCPNKESTIDFSSDIGGDHGSPGVVILFQSNNIRDCAILITNIILSVPTLIIQFVTMIITTFLINPDAF